MNNLNFAVGGFYLKSKELFFLFDQLNKNKENWLKDNYTINSVYDAFPNSIFGGGRCIVGQPWSVELILKTIKYFNNSGISMRYTFTNPFIEKKHLSDYYCNLLLELAHNEQNAVIVNSDILENYIRQNYPKFKIILSVTKDVIKFDDYLKKQEQYDLIVPNVSIFSKLTDKQLHQLNKDKIEILVNEECLVSDCKFKSDHYNIESLGNLNLDSCLSKEFCSNKHPNIKKNPHDVHLSTAKITELNQLFGFYNFKLAGRVLPSGRYFEEIAKYLISDKYKINYYNSLLYFFDHKDSFGEYQ